MTEPTDTPTGEDHATPGEVPWRRAKPSGATAERPLGEDRKYFEEPKEGGANLADQGSTIDEDGDDIREYTGEPVETEEGWVLPRQQNAGPGNIAGGGEWPDPDTPSAQPGTGSDHPGSSAGRRR